MSKASSEHKAFDVYVQINMLIDRLEEEGIISELKATDKAAVLFISPEYQSGENKKIISSLIDQICDMQNHEHK